MPNPPLILHQTAMRIKIHAINYIYSNLKIQGTVRCYYEHILHWNSYL